MSQDNLSKLLGFLRQLEEARIAFELRRDDAIMVEIAVPGERWEVEFLEEGEIEVERYVSNGHIADESALADLFARFSDAEPTPDEAVNHDDATAR
jgi:hypothetical protein